MLDNITSGMFVCLFGEIKHSLYRPREFINLLFSSENYKQNWVSRA